MSVLGPKTARDLAVHVLLRVLVGGAYADSALEKALAKNPLEQNDRALLTEIVYGVLRWKKTIDWTLDGFLSRPIATAPNDIAMILRVGAYQMIYLDRIPEYAAVDTAVEIARRGKTRNLAGLVNAVLRRLSREGPRELPQNVDVCSRMSIEFSHPEWLVRLLIDRYGPETASDICKNNNTIPSSFVRVNRLLAASGAARIVLESQGILARPCRYASDGLEIIEGFSSLPQAPAHQEGLVYIMDEASMLVAPALCPQKGSSVLDACAAPGGKTTHLGEIMRNEGSVTALDVHPARLKMITQNARRLGVDIIETKRLDAQKAGQVYPDRFDAALVDAPCSGTGVYRGRPDIRWRVRDVAALTRLQASILDSVAKTIRPGGALVYSTCSILEEENADTISDFIERNPEFELEGLGAYLPPNLPEDSEGMVQIWPHIHSIDGFFIARMRRGAPKTWI